VDVGGFFSVTGLGVVVFSKRKLEEGDEYGEDAGDEGAVVSSDNRTVMDLVEEEGEADITTEESVE